MKPHGTDARWPTRKRKHLKSKLRKMETRAWELGYDLTVLRTQPTQWVYRLEKHSEPGTTYRSGAAQTLALCLDAALRAVLQVTIAEG